MHHGRFVGRGILAVLLAIWLCTAANAAPTLLANVPDYKWTDGCTPTSASMLMGYYAINGYQGKSYSNLLSGATLNTFTTSSTAVTNAIRTMAIDMGTHYDASRKSDSTYNYGSSLLWYFNNGQRFTAQNSSLTADQAYGYSSDIVYGLWQYVNQKGYSKSQASFFNQLIYDPSIAPYGFTFADFENSINAGRPVLIQLQSSTTGHTVIGYGYDSSNETIYLHDTWSAGAHTMSWGGSYGGMSILGVTAAILPEPRTLLLLVFGLIGVGALSRKHLRYRSGSPARS